MKDNRGFISLRSIAYLCAILLLIIVCVAAFRGYVSSSYMVKANRVAQKAYEGASEFMENQVKAGTLSEFNIRAKHFGKALSMELQEKILKINYTGDDVLKFVERYPKFYKEGMVRYIVLESAENATKTRADNPILEMLPYTITDDNVFDYSFLIEYNSVSGKVLSVFYSSETETFSYEGDVADFKNVLLRSKELLTQKKQGYFGVKIDEIFE